MTLKQMYNFNFHGCDFKSYSKTKKSDEHDKIEIQLKILQLLLNKQWSANEIDWVYFGSNQSIVDRLKPIYPKFEASHVITYLQRLAEANLLSISYNPSKHEFGKSNRYCGETEPREMKPNVFIDFNIKHWREIKLNIDYIATLSSVIDPETDPIYLDLPRGCVARRFIKKRCMTSHIRVKERYKEIARSMRKKLLTLKIKFKNFQDAIQFFITKTVNKYYKAKGITNHKFAKIETEKDKQDKQMRYQKTSVNRQAQPPDEPPPIDFDTGEVKDNDIHEVSERQSQLLDDFFRNI